MRRCGQCKVAKPLDAFYRHKNRALGRSNVCKACHSFNDSTVQQRNKKWRRTEKGQKWQQQFNKKRREYNKTTEGRYRLFHRDLRRKYGIDVWEWAHMFNAQKGLCAVCRDQLIFEITYVDHNHQTKKVRGLLCHNCNTALGHAKDNIDRLFSLVSYLRERC